MQVYSKAQQKVFVYQVSGGTWTQRYSLSYTITAGTQFTMYALVRAGQAGNYAGTCPAGQVGLWCSDSSDNSFDNFEVRDMAGPFEVDGRYFSDRGNVRVVAQQLTGGDAYPTRCWKPTARLTATMRTRASSGGASAGRSTAPRSSVNP